MDKNVWKKQEDMSFVHMTSVSNEIQRFLIDIIAKKPRPCCYSSNWVLRNQLFCILMVACDLSY